MPTLTIKGLPEPVYRRLKARADANRRSLNGEIILCLERAVFTSPFDPAEWLARARAFRAELRGKPMTEKQLKAARSAGRS